MKIKIKMKARKKEERKSKKKIKMKTRKKEERTKSSAGWLFPIEEKDGVKEGVENHHATLHISRVIHPRDIVLAEASSIEEIGGVGNVVHYWNKIKLK